MYGNAYIDPNEKAAGIFAGEDPQKLAEFEARIARGEKIEPKDWMPKEYRKQLIRMIEQHAHSEIIGALPEGTWITRAPGFKRKLALMAKVQDEVGHGQLLYSAAETLGKSREAMINDLITGKSKYSNVFNYPAFTWADACVIAWLIDAGAIINQVANAKGSYGPYCRALDRICTEESFHLKYGHDNVVTLATGSPVQRKMVQEALNRWWPPIMHFFGPSDKISNHTEIFFEHIKYIRCIPFYHSIGINYTNLIITYSMFEYKFFIPHNSTTSFIISFDYFKVTVIILTPILPTFYTIF